MIEARRFGFLRWAASLGVAVVMVGGSVSGADVKASRSCRKTIGREVGKLVRTRLQAIETCYRGQDRANAPRGACNLPSAGGGRFATKRMKALAKVNARCAADDPVRTNYAGADPAVAVDRVEETLAGNALLVQGNGTVAGDAAALRCAKALAKLRAAIVGGTVGAATACQTRRDRAASVFGPLDDACVRAAAAGRLATAAGRACAAATGTCTPLPQCAVEATGLAAARVARSVYAVGGPRPQCGDGTVQPPEQCEDGNTVGGDGCSATCETEGASCDAVAGSQVLGSRTVTVAIDTPRLLAGVRVDLDYPQFQSGVPGTAESDLVQATLSVLQGGGAALALVNDRDSDLSVIVAGATALLGSGPLLSATMEACVAKEVNLCNRNQNVIGCCDASTDTDGDLTFQECTDPNAPVICPAGQFPASTIGAGTPEDCCPGDNACVTQASATQCTVTDPVDAAGAAVEGVTCTVTVSGT